MQATLTIKTYENNNRREVGDKTTRYYIAEVSGDAVDFLLQAARNELTEIDPWDIDTDNLGDALCEMVGHGTRYHFDKPEIDEIIDKLRDKYRRMIKFDVIFDN